MLAAALAAALLVAGPPMSGGAPAHIVAEEARWTGLAAAGELAADRADMFLISGEVRNDGATALGAVRLVYELTAAGAVVAREHGFNRRAEALRDPRVESGEVAAATLAIAPLRSGETDRFRMIFFRDAVPRFDAWRVRIDTVLPPAPPPPAAARQPER